MRVEFFISGKDDGYSEKRIGSERYDMLGLYVGNDADYVGTAINWRLDEYLMSREEMNKFCDEAASFGSREAAERASEKCIPVVVRMKVVTVQRKGEAFEQTKLRVVLPLKMTPLYLWDLQTIVQTDLNDSHTEALFSLPRKRPTAEVLEEWAMRDGRCSICFHGEFIGAFITKLHCGCVFHSHCIIRKLEGYNRCPSCRQQVFKPSLLFRNAVELTWWGDDDGLRDYGVGGLPL